MPPIARPKREEQRQGQRGLGGLQETAVQKIGKRRGGDLDPAQVDAVGAREGGDEAVIDGGS